ncbi:hypothetical protein [Pseudoduganella aquatica]|uniref:Uncharacterized protein n=1 Tax=Pseudoduganella aquatica TaxID=2660641 RepID=A0A7X4KNA4_9BURK|nr:hypothetical protein [Pseudoduganella aquatica]MYN08695.1 hypothetical protein [Pseudoduganella aquatica]
MGYLKLNVYTGRRSVATFEAARPLRNFFEDFQKKFKKTLKFPKSLPLPCLRCAAKRLQQAKKAGEKLQNFLKIFGFDPKVPENPAVTGLDVAKKSHITPLFFA